MRSPRAVWSTIHARCAATGGAANGTTFLEGLDHLDPVFDRWLADAREAFPAPGPRHFIAATAPASERTRRRAWAIGATAAGAPAMSTVAVAPFTAEGGADARTLAEGLAEAVRGAVPADRARARPITGGGWFAAALSPRADFVARVSIRLAGGRAVVRARIEDGRAGAPLWSTEVDGDTRAAPALRAKLAGRLSAVTTCAFGGPRRLRSHDATAALFGACAAIGGGQREAMLRATRAFVLRAPDDAYAHALFARAQATGADTLPAAFAESAFGAARRGAERALALDPATGDAHGALAAIALARRDWASAETWLARGLVADPGNAQLNAGMSNLLRNVGRLEDAVVHAERALALDPASVDKIATLASLLDATDQPRAALALLDRAAIAHPDDPMLWSLHFSLLLRGGDVTGARAMLDPEERAPGIFEPVHGPRFRRQVAAFGPPDSPEAAIILARTPAILKSRPELASPILLSLVSIGHTDPAIETALAHPIDTEILFRRVTAPLRRDARFLAVAERQGLLAYWRATGRWPDLCLTPDLPYRCA